MQQLLKLLATRSNIVFFTYIAQCPRTYFDNLHTQDYRSLPINIRAQKCEEKPLFVQLTFIFLSFRRRNCWPKMFIVHCVASSKVKALPRALHHVPLKIDTWQVRLSTPGTRNWPFLYVGPSVRQRASVQNVTLDSQKWFESQNVIHFFDLCHGR